jgi:hypothetical protein
MQQFSKMTITIEDTFILAASLILAQSIMLFLFPSACTPLLSKQPASITKLIRTLRPFTKLIIGIVWILMRLVIFPRLLDDANMEQEVCSSRDNCRGMNRILWNNVAQNEGKGDSSDNLQRFGLLDIILRLCHLLSWKIVHFVHGRTNCALLENIVAKVCLYANDFLGIVLLVTLSRYYQKLGHYSMEEMKRDCIEFAFAFAKNHISVVRNSLLREEEKMEVALKESLWKQRNHVTKVLPKDGRDIQSLIQVSWIHVWSVHSLFSACV